MKLLILNFGSQYSQLIASQARKQNIMTDVMNPHKVNKEIASSYDAMIISGGPSSVDHISKEEFQFIKEFNKPILGVCFGMQLLAYLYDGKVETGIEGQYGEEKINITKDNKFLTSDMNNSTIWMSHFDEVTKAPEGFEVIADSSGIIAAFANEEKSIYATQFHPEVTHTEKGIDMIKHFLFDIAKLDKTYFIEDKVKSRIKEIKEIVGDEKVVLGLSGGVDSSVLAFLLHKAIGSQLTCLFVDHGLLRLNEGGEVLDFFKESGLKIIKLDHEKQMLEALKGVTDPEAKRKIIGKEFINAFELAKEAAGDYTFLAQGTIYSDVIESSKDGEKSHLIKSHHNVGGLPDDMKVKILEPLKDLFKDEVRELGLVLGLKENMVFRHPFPGPGLGIRIIGEVTKEKADIVRAADDILIKSLREFDLYDKVGQAACIMTNTDSVGVQGDERTFQKVIAIRIVDSKNFMTASFSRISMDTLATISNRITNKVKEVNRIVYDITNKPPSTIEWE